MTTAIQAADARAVKTASYYVVIELDQVTYTFAEHPIPGLTVTGYGLTMESGVAPKLTLFKGRSSISEATFRLSDKDNQVKRLVSKDALNSTVTIYRGYKDLALGEWQEIGKPHIADIKLNRDGSYTFKARDNRTNLTGSIFDIPWGLGTLSADISDSATVLDLDPGGVWTFRHTSYHGWLTDPLVSANEFSNGGGQYAVIGKEIMRVTSYTGATALNVLRAQLGTTAVFHSSGSEVAEMLVFKDHLISLMLYILQTGATGTNGLNDMGIPGWGFDMDQSQLDLDSFQDYVWADVPELQLTQFEFWLMERENGLQFFEDELLKMCLGYLLNNRQGQIRLRLLDIPPHLGWPAADPASIDNMEIMAGPGWDYKTDTLYNAINYGFAYDPTTGNYGVESTYKAQESIDLYEMERPLNLYSRGLRMINAGLGDNAFDYFMTLMQRVLNLAVQGFPMVKIRAPMTRQMLIPGEAITIQDDQIPNLFDTADLDQLMIVMNTDVKYKSDVVNVELLQTEFQRRFDLKENLVLLNTTDYTLVEDSDNSDLYQGGKDVIYIWYNGSYDFSDVMEISFLIDAPNIGTADLSVRYQNALNSLSYGIINFQLAYVNSANNTYLIKFPNFRENVYIVKFDWYNTTGFDPTSIKITNSRFYNLDYEYKLIS